MTTMEVLGLIAIVLTLLLAVGAVIMLPIYNKAVEQKNEIERFEFNPPTGSTNKNYEFALGGQNDYYRENLLASDMANFV